MKRSTEKKKLDAIFSRYVRKSNADHAGNVSCFTCGVVKNWLEVDNGHFITRSKQATRWLYKPEEGLINVAPQCRRCNGFLGGQQFVFAQNIDKKFGEGTAETILQMSNQTSHVSTLELVELRKHYEELYSKLS